MSKHKLKIRLSPDEMSDLAGILSATKEAAEEVVQKILLDFVTTVRERRAEQEFPPEAEEVVVPNSLALEQLETEARKATKSRLDAKHRIEGVAEGLEQFLARQEIDLTPTSVADEIAKRRHSGSVAAGLSKLSSPLRKLISSGGKVLLSVGSMLTEHAIDGDRG